MTAVIPSELLFDHPKSPTLESADHRYIRVYVRRLDHVDPAMDLGVVIGDVKAAWSAAVYCPKGRAECTVFAH